MMVVVARATRRAYVLPDTGTLAGGPSRCAVRPAAGVHR